MESHQTQRIILLFFLLGFIAITTHMAPTASAALEESDERLKTAIPLAIDDIMETCNWDRKRVLFSKEKISFRDFFGDTDPTDTVLARESFPDEVFCRAKELMHRSNGVEWDPELISAVNQKASRDPIGSIYLTPAISIKAKPDTYFYFFLVEGPVGDFSNGVVTIHLGREVEVRTDLISAFRGTESLPQE
jgi:hypothetical protein